MPCCPGHAGDSGALSSRAAAPMPNLQIIDAHHHRCDFSRSYPWLEGPAEPFRYHGDDRPLPRNYLIDDYLADAQGFKLAGCVHIENGAADPLWEAGWVQGVHESHGLPSVQVAKASLSDPAVLPHLEELAALPTVRGYGTSSIGTPTRGTRTRPGLT